MADPYYTLITGASEGLGVNLTIECAKRNRNIIAVALPGPQLHHLKDFIEHNFPVKVETIPADLTSDAGCRHVWDTVHEMGLQVNMLVNNAGLVISQPFHEMPVDECLRQIELNVIGTTMLTRYFINDLLANKPSHILNTSSLSAFFYLPRKQLYGASKDFVYSFSRGLRAEYHDQGVSVTVLCPGGLSSNIRSVLANNQGSWIARQSITSPEYVAAKAIQACFEGKEVVIPGKINRLFLFLDRLLPQSLKVRITRRQMQRLTQKKANA